MYVETNMAKKKSKQASLGLDSVVCTSVMQKPWNLRLVGLDYIKFDSQLKRKKSSELEALEY